jgi:hypothetical protein
MILWGGREQLFERVCLAVEKRQRIKRLHDFTLEEGFHLESTVQMIFDN